MTDMPSLDALRRDIDVVDATILEALQTRQALVQQIRDAKISDHKNFFRPAREAQILRRLIAQCKTMTDVQLIIQIWQEIFSAALAKQSLLQIFVAEEGGQAVFEAARGNFGHAAQYMTEDLRSIFKILVDEPVALAVVPYKPIYTQQILSAFRDNVELRIVGLLPFLQKDNAPQYLVLGTLPFEDSGDDLTFFGFDNEIRVMDGHHPHQPGLLGVVARPVSLK